MQKAEREIWFTIVQKPHFLRSASFSCPCIFARVLDFCFSSHIFPSVFSVWDDNKRFRSLEEEEKASGLHQGSRVSHFIYCFFHCLAGGKHRFTELNWISWRSGGRETKQVQHHWKELQLYLATSPQQPEDTIKKQGLEQRRWKCSSLPLDRRQQNNYAEQTRVFDGSSQTVAKGSAPSLTGMCHCLCIGKGSAMRSTEETISVVAYLHVFVPLLGLN